MILGETCFPPSTIGSSGEFILSVVLSCTEVRELRFHVPSPGICSGLFTQSCYNHSNIISFINSTKSWGWPKKRYWGSGRWSMGHILYRNKVRMQLINKVTVKKIKGSGPDEIWMIMMVMTIITIIIIIIKLSGSKLRTILKAKRVKYYIWKF